jgi:hypothetical protein
MELIKQGAWLACFLAIGGVLHGGLDAPVAGRATVELRFAKAQYFFGEPCVAEFVLKNADDREISFNTGGDYRGSARELRYLVRAIVANGEVVPPADPTLCFGGILGMQKLKPGEEWRHELWVLDYLQLTQPGKYTVRITHDLGWMGYRDRVKSAKQKEAFDSKDWLAPIGEAQIEFVVPDAQQAENILDALTVEFKKEDRDKKRIPYARDFALPAYLEPLKKRALAGELYFLEAIGEMPTKEATLTLMELAEDKNFPHANAAAYALSCRMPFGFKDRPDWSQEKRARLMAAAWDERYAPRARAIAGSLLAGFNPDTPAPLATNVRASGYFSGLVASAFKDVDWGAQILAGIGMPDDIAILDITLGKAEPLAFTPRRGANAQVGELPAPMPNLMRAMDAIRERAGEAGKNLSVGRLMYFHWLAMDAAPRSKEWLEWIRLIEPHDRYPLQIAALESIPAPMPPECRELVMKLLGAKDCGVIVAACRVAGQSEERAFLPGLLDIIKAEDNWAVIDAAGGAAWQLGARREVFAEIVGRMADMEFGNNAFDWLIGRTVDANGRNSRTDLSHRERLAIQAAWREWVAKHGADLDAGKKFKPGDDENLHGKLFGRAARWTLPDGKSWPSPTP